MKKANGKPAKPVLTADMQRVIEARSHDPFSVLGRHPDGSGQCVVRAFLPHTQAVEIVESGTSLERIPGTDLFEWSGAAADVPERYRLRRLTSWGDVREFYDPYCFTPFLDEAELERFHAGEHLRAHEFLGRTPRNWMA